MHSLVEAVPGLPSLSTVERGKQNAACDTNWQIRTGMRACRHTAPMSGGTAGATGDAALTADGCCDRGGGTRIGPGGVLHIRSSHQS